MLKWLFLIIYICLIVLHLLCPTKTPFTFGLNQRAPYTAGDRCLLCRCERKDGAVPSEAGILGQNGTAQPNKMSSSLQLPLWVCSDCRRTVEKEDRHTSLEQSLGVSRVCVCGELKIQRRILGPKVLKRCHHVIIFKHPAKSGRSSSDTCASLKWTQLLVENRRTQYL